MRILVQNVAKVRAADIELNGITVISGHNNTGKTTILKSLDVMLQTYGNFEENIKEERRKSIEQIISKHMLSLFYNNNTSWLKIDHFINSLSQKIMKIPLSDMTSDMIKNEWNEEVDAHALDENYHYSNNESYLNDLCGELEKVLKRNKEEYSRYLAEINLKNEFNNQAGNFLIDESSTIALRAEERSASIMFRNNKVISESQVNLESSGVIYLETQNILDDINHFDDRKKI